MFTNQTILFPVAVHTFIYNVKLTSTLAVTPRQAFTDHNPFMYLLMGVFIKLECINVKQLIDAFFFLS